MAMFILEMEHSPDMCPAFNEEVKREFKEKYGKIEEIADKLEIKILINLVVFIEHKFLMVVEASSIEAVEGFIQEMDFYSFNTTTLRHAMYLDDAMKSLD